MKNKHEYYAHSKEGKPREEWHRLEDHLKRVAEMARDFANDFGVGEWGYLAGTLPRYKEILITFNEPMRTGVSFHYNFNPGRNIKINWINQYTVQILLDVELKPSVEYKVLLNDTENKKYNIKDLNGNILKEDTAVSFGTASEEMEKKFKIIEKQAENGVIINKSKYAWLGIKTENINNEIRKEFNIKPLVKGIIIKEVSSNSPASKAGLKENDIIQSMFDEKINNKENFDFYINNLYLGSKIKLKIYRNGDIIEQEIKLDVSQKK